MRIKTIKTKKVQNRWSSFFALTGFVCKIYAKLKNRCVVYFFFMKAFVFEYIQVLFHSET